VAIRPALKAEAEELEISTRSFTINARMSLGQSSSHWSLSLQNGIRVTLHRLRDNSQDCTELTDLKYRPNRN
jgi:hypothetical protein